MQLKMLMVSRLAMFRYTVERFFHGPTILVKGLILFAGEYSFRDAEIRTHTYEQSPSIVGSGVIFFQATT